MSHIFQVDDSNYEAILRTAANQQKSPEAMFNGLRKCAFKALLVRFFMTRIVLCAMPLVPAMPKSRKLSNCVSTVMVMMMPTYEALARFLREYGKLTAEQRLQFAIAYRQMVADLKAKRSFKARLRILQMTDHPGIFEMSWGQGGRATFSFGPEKRPGERHIV